MERQKIYKDVERIINSNTMAKNMASAITEYIERLLYGQHKIDKQTKNRMTEEEYISFWKENRVKIPFMDKERWLIKKIIDMHNKHI